MMTQVEQKRIGSPQTVVSMLMIVLSVVLAVSYLLFSQQIIRLFEYYLTPDGVLTANGVRELVSTYFFMTVLLFGAGFSLLKAQNEVWLAKTRQLLFREPLLRFAPFQPAYHFMMMTSTAVGVMLIVLMRIAYNNRVMYDFLYFKDHGLIDLAVPSAMAVSGVLILTAVWRVWQDPKFRGSRLMVSLGYLFIAALLIVYAGEEVSWGQDFLNWNTPELFAGNIERQTNIHNYFNPYFMYGYIALSVIPIVVLVSAWMEFNKRFIPLNRLFLPHPSQIALGLLIGFVAVVWFREQEMLEEMVGAFVLFYSLRIFLCFRSRNLSLGD